MKRILFPLNILLVILVANVWPQDLTGNLNGRILDSEGNPIPEILITVAGPSLLGKREVFTDQTGFFGFSALPPGTYVVVIEHSSFQKTKIENVVISIGKTRTIGEIRLEQKSQEEFELTVFAKRPLIDPVSTSIGENLKPEIFEQLPLARNFKSIPLVLPHVNESYFGDGPNISGSTGLENVYFIDGVNVTDTYNAATSTNLPYNFIEEIEVKSGGYQAEYSRALGGIINVITRSGTNEFKIDGFAFFSNNTLSSPAKIGLLDAQPESYSSYDFGFSVGGPIVKNRIWFYAAYNRNYDNQELEIPNFGVYRDQKITNMYAGKLTWQVSNKTSVVLSIFGDPSRYDNIGPSDIASGRPSALKNPDPVLGYRELGGNNYSLNVQHFAGQHSLFEGSISYYQSSNNIRGLTDMGSDEPLFIDQSTNTWEGGFGQNEDNSLKRISSRVKASFFLGSHTLKAGLDFEHNSWNVDAHYTSPGNITQVSNDLYLNYVFAQNASVSNRIISFYMQDSWLVSKRLRLNFGIRWDGQFFIGTEGKIVQRFVDQFQPRVGFVYQPSSYGTQKLYGSYCRFYQQFPLVIAMIGYGGSMDNRLQYFDEDPRNSSSSPYSQIIFSKPDDPIFNEVKGAKGQHSDEFILGYERIFGSNFKFSLRGIYRNLRDAFGLGLDQGMIFFGNYGRGDLDFLWRPKRQYTALEFILARIGASRWNFSVSYVLAKSYGNYSGLFNFDNRQAWANNNASYVLAEQMPNSIGLLSNDRRHTLKFYGSYNISSYFKLGTFCTFQTGIPLNEFGATATGVTGLHFKCLQERGSAGRTPNLYDVNFRVSYDLSRYLYSKVSTIVIFDILHAGNPRKALDFDQIKYQAVDGEGNQINPNPSFGNVLRYQPPMTVRLGIQIGFK